MYTTVNIVSPTKVNKASMRPKAFCLSITMSKFPQRLNRGLNVPIKASKLARGTANAHFGLLPNNMGINSGAVAAIPNAAGVATDKMILSERTKALFSCSGFSLAIENAGTSVRETGKEIS